MPSYPACQFIFSFLDFPLVKRFIKGGSFLVSWQSPTVDQTGLDPHIRPASSISSAGILFLFIINFHFRGRIVCWILHTHKVMKSEFKWMCWLRTQFSSRTLAWYVAGPRYKLPALQKNFFLNECVLCELRNFSNQRNLVYNLSTVALHMNYVQLLTSVLVKYIYRHRHWGC